MGEDGALTCTGGLFLAVWVTGGDGALAGAFGVWCVAGVCCVVAARDVVRAQCRGVVVVVVDVVTMVTTTKCDVAEFEGHVIKHLRTKFLQSPRY